MRRIRLFNRLISSLIVLVVSGFAVQLLAQDQDYGLPQPSPELEVFKHEVGTWKADATFFTPQGEMKAEGKEVNRMIGGFWMISDMEMDIEGMAFEGHGTFGYDAKSKKYTGSWMDSANPHLMHMTGSWDAKKRIFTYMSEGLDMMGNPEKSKMTTEFSEDWKTRTFVRWIEMPGSDELTKVMEIVYKKSDETSK